MWVAPHIGQEVGQKRASDFLMLATFFILKRLSQCARHHGSQLALELPSFSFHGSLPVWGSPFPTHVTLVLALWL